MRPEAARNRSVQLVAHYFAAARIYLLAGSIGLVWIAPEITSGAFASPHVAGVTHLFTLGWLTMIIFGVSYQIVPRALRAIPSPAWIGQLGFWTFAPGVALFACGVASSSGTLRHAGIALVAPGILLTVVSLSLSVLRGTERDATRNAVLWALLFLFLALILGIILVSNLRSGFIGAARLRVLAAHMHLALVGWALMMIVGISHRILPTVLASTTTAKRWTGRAVQLLSMGLTALIAGLLMQMRSLTWAGVIVLECGMGCFLWQAIEYYRTRTRREPDVALRFVYTGLIFLALSAVLGPFVLVANATAQAKLATAYVLAGLLGGLIMTVMGHLHRVFPNFVRAARSTNRPASANPRRDTTLFSVGVARLQLGAMVSAVLFLLLGIASDTQGITLVGACLYLAGVLLMLSQMLRVVRQAGAMAEM